MLRKLTPSDAATFRALRLRALAEDSQAFGESVEEFERVTVEDVARRLSVDSAESFVVGAFDESELIGTAGLYREGRLKRRHTAGIWGVYVAPEHRGRGLSKALMTMLIQEARKMPGLESLHLSVATAQDAAQRLYAGLGFRSYGVEQRALKIGARYVDEAHMALRLDEISSTE